MFTTTIWEKRWRLIIMKSTITKDELRHLAGVYDIGEVAEELGIERKRRLYYLIECGRIEPPAITIGMQRRRYYSREDLEAIRQSLDEMD
jgi:hypothetical protein